MDVCDVKTSSGPSATPTTSAEPSAVILTDNDRRELQAHLAADGNGQEDIADMDPALALALLDGYRNDL